MNSTSLGGGGAGLRPRDLILSVGLHGLLLAVLTISKGCDLGSEEEPLFNPDEVMQVRMVALPKSKGRNPDRASRAPMPAAGVPQGTAAPAAPSSPDQMSFKDKTIDKSKQSQGSSSAATNTQARSDLLANLRREQLVRAVDPTAPLGTENRSASDPNGVLDEGAVGWGFGGGGTMEPELAQYTVAVRNAVLPHWTPLPKLIQENPRLQSIVVVWTDEVGTVSVARVGQPSGNTSFDESCVRAVQKAGRLPLPPEKYRPLAEQGIGILFLASDAL